MVILGIETSCDETAAAIVKDGREILSNVVASSSEMHVKTGGIIPEKAAREQVKSIIPVVDAAISNSKYQISNIDAIAVTTGPGLIGSLLVGVETAKTLSWVWNKPIVPVNHLVAHIYANWLRDKRSLALRDRTKTISEAWRFALEHRDKDIVPNFPAIALVVSGGHTDLVLMKDHGKIEWIGGTRDDAAGEAFDKTARLLGLGYPGGPAIAAEAVRYKPQSSKLQVSLPRPLIDSDDFDFSFSGLKTAVLREVSPVRQAQGKQVPRVSRVARAALAWEIQEAITDVLVEKTLRAAKKYKVPTLLLAGGVAANTRLREKFKLEIENWKLEIDFRVPPPQLCTDNAAYIASFAEYNFKPVPWQKITALPSLMISGGTQ
ncbi:MAG: tRNA (adenosine(37)-N6)-threonylcarbamoyltransferase complex transferase subunit TsaD [bacterium]|nr:tRNA (adenosine(37)-N6)-threonylcarbamoyltransferase complex transferase subunit TsaD [bacterium]